MSGSRYFGDMGPKVPHLVLAKGGRPGEIADLRHDTEVGFSRVEEQIRTAWNDLKGDVTSGKASLTLVEEAYRDTPALYSFLRYDRQNTLTFKYQMGHDWLVGSEVHPHVHIIPMSAPVSPQVVRFSGYYTWSRAEYDVQLPALSGWTSFYVERTIGAADQYHELLIDAAEITPPSWAHWSSHLHVHWVNETTHANYTYKTDKDHGTPAANILLLSFDTHILLDRLGSQPEYPT